MRLVNKLIYGVAGLLVLAGLLLPGLISATTYGPWSLNAPNPIVFDCGGTYAHTLDTVTPGVGGAFTGTGHYDANNSYTWNISGTITVDAITFQIVYTGSNAGYTLNGTGTIALDGSISGNVDGNCQTFSMPLGTATHSEINTEVGPPTSKDQCKNGGWTTFNNPAFKNQGDCVSFVQSNENAIGNKSK